MLLGLFHTENLPLLLRVMNKNILKPIIQLFHFLTLY